LQFGKGPLPFGRFHYNESAMAAINDLSEREREILRLVATGASNKEIAQRLVISPNTVKVHLRNIFAKIKVVSRTEATLFAIQHGLTDAPGSHPPPAPETHTAQLPAEKVRPRWLRWALLFGLLGALLLTLLAGRILLERRDQAARPAPPALVRWQVQPDLPEGPSVVAGAVYENAIYLFGSLSGHADSAVTLRYTPAGGRYPASAPKPHAVTRAQAAVIGERIYIPGGQAQGAEAVDYLEIYDPRLDAWTMGAPLPVPLYGYALAALEGKLYLFGGVESEGERFSRAVYVYDPQLDAWWRGSDLPQEMALGAAVPLEAGKILLAGGINAAGGLDRVWIYYPQRALNNEAAWEERTPLPEARVGLSMTTLAGAVYLVGGDRPDLPPLQYNPQRDSWEPFELPPQPVGFLPVLLPYETHLHVMGGSIDNQVQSAHQTYQAIYTILIPAIQ
jgi:DNA-binding CsgD family transcriptional regulator